MIIKLYLTFLRYNRNLDTFSLKLHFNRQGI